MISGGNTVASKAVKVPFTPRILYPKITAELRKSGEHVAEKTVGNYMRQMGIKAQWVKPYIQTTIDSDLSHKLKNILNEQSS